MLLTKGDVLMKNYSKILADNISFLRKANNLTQESLAEKVNLSFQAISKWENGQSSPDITLLPVLADIFGVHIDDLFGKVIIKEQMCIRDSICLV